MTTQQQIECGNKIIDILCSYDATLLEEIKIMLTLVETLTTTAKISK